MGRPTLDENQGVLYIYADTGCSLNDQQIMIDDWDGWQERAREIRCIIVTLIYIYICVCVRKREYIYACVCVCV